MLDSAFKATHEQNRMKNEGNVVLARELYYSSKTKNLPFLLEKRFAWMNKYIKSSDHGIEVGCGTGISKDFIKCDNYLLTDFTDSPWLDVPWVDALNTPFESASLNFVVSSNMIHHVPYPRRFFNEMSRILKPGGYLLIQEINASLVMRFLLQLMRHEGYSFEPDVFDESVICTDPEDLWSANCAIPRLLFDDEKKFEFLVPEFKIKHQSFSEFFIFANSGGVIAKTRYVPLPRILLSGLKLIDDFLCKALPMVFALQRQVVLRRK